MGYMTMSDMQLPRSHKLTDEMTRINVKHYKEVCKSFSKLKKIRTMGKKTPFLQYSFSTCYMTVRESQYEVLPWKTSWQEARDRGQEWLLFQFPRAPCI